MVRRRRLASPVLPVTAPASPLDDDDLLLEILLRLPPQPSSLLRASVVCNRWRRLVSDPGFLRRFRAHHRKPPLLGFISLHGYGPRYCFTPTLDPPDRIPAPCFSLTQRPGGECLALVDCRHGLALFLNKKQPEAVVWNPISGRQCRVALPPEFDNTVAAVLCAAGDDDPTHAHGDCDLSSFKLALVRSGQGHTRAFACLYKSKSAAWGNIISTTITDSLSNWGRGTVLIRNTFCWMISAEGDILQLDFDDARKLVVIEKPLYRHTGYFSSEIIRTEETSLGLIVLTELSMLLWLIRMRLAHGSLRKPFELASHLSPRAPVEDICPLIQGYDEDQNVIFLRTSIGLFMIQLDSMRFKEIFGTNFITSYFPYTSYYASGNSWPLHSKSNKVYLSF
ncbi:hypothetical protein ACQ4PT_048132 [Festuca glaucescens]